MLFCTFLVLLRFSVQDPNVLALQSIAACILRNWSQDVQPVLGWRRMTQWLGTSWDWEEGQWCLLKKNTSKLNQITPRMTTLYTSDSHSFTISLMAWKEPDPLRIWFTRNLRCNKLFQTKHPQTKAIQKRQSQQKACDSYKLISAFRWIHDEVSGSDRAKRHDIHEGRLFLGPLLPFLPYSTATLGAKCINMSQQQTSALSKLRWSVPAHSRIGETAVFNIQDPRC